MTDRKSLSTLSELCRFNAVDCPEVEAFRYEGRSTSYLQFDAYTNQVGNALIAEGLSTGSRAGFLDKNSDLFYQMVLGCAKAGAVSVGINWRLAPPEVAYILNDCKAEVLFVGPEFYGLVAQIADELPHIKRIVAMTGESHAQGHPEWPGFMSWRDAQSTKDPQVAVTGNDVAVQMYTSGTTGHPKGVQLAHRCFFELDRETPNSDMDFDQWSADDVSLVAMPSFHIGGVGWGMQGLKAGARNIVVSEFDPGETLDLIENDGITKLFLVPAALRMVLQHPKARQTNYDRIKYVLYGASPIPLDLLREAIEVMQCGFVQLYGMTETTGSATYLPPQDHQIEGGPKMKSAGKPLPGVTLKIVDDDGNILPPHEVGEICIASPANMVGYGNLPEATAKTLIDGYVHTGDAGYLDEDGYVYVHDRVKDMIVSGGENIYPAEVESALFGHPAVMDVAVIGVPDERWGEAVKAVIVKAADTDVTEDELIGYAREKIAGFKLPKSVDFIAELPRNPSGKILKRELRKPYWEGRERQVN